MCRDIKFLTATVHCKICNAKLYQNSILVSYEGNISIEYLNEEVQKKIPNKIVCKTCKKAENQKGYSFYHQQKITD